MKIDLMNTLYVTSMVLLSFVAAIVLTKTISKYFGDKSDESDEKDEKDL